MRARNCLNIRFSSLLLAKSASPLTNQIMPFTPVALARRMAKKRLDLGPVTNLD
jgi:hypothetical protein